MKKIFFFLVTIFFSLISFAQLKVNESGYVGINNQSPTYTLDVNGRVRFTSGDGLIYDNYDLFPATDYGISLGTYNSRFYSVAAGQADFSSLNAYDIHANEGYFFTIYDLSDRNLKSNVTDLSKTESGKLFNLRPVRYNITLEKKMFKDSLKAPESKMETTEHIGFIAQEVKEIFPELVGENKEGFLGIKYTELIPLLVQALKEQDAKIKNLEERLIKLENATK
jgi:hypothetical protein